MWRFIFSQLNTRVLSRGKINGKLQLRNWPCGKVLVQNLKQTFGGGEQLERKNSAERNNNNICKLLRASEQWSSKRWNFLITRPPPPFVCTGALYTNGFNIHKLLQQ
jgi:hypothetical protein